MASKQPLSPISPSTSRSGSITPTIRPSNLRHLSSGQSSPHRHHHRTISATRHIKETTNARAEYTNSEDDGASQRRINQYLIQQEIGRGSFGSVHLATDQFGTEYAVKEFSKHRLRRRAKSNLLRQARQHNEKLGPSGLSSHSGGQHDSKAAAKKSHSAATDSSFDLIREEIAIMKKLNHENLVSLIEVLDDPQEDSLYMVLEMCKKGVVMRVDIEEDVEPYDDENCRLWFRDLILGIEYLHAQGVVHRDIKPDNCLLTETDTLKLVDFGVSEMFDKGSDMKIAKSAGSPAFMAPELCIIQKTGVYGKPADIWSMGVTLFCLRFGRVPFQKSNMLDLYDAIVKDDLMIPSDCTSELRDLLVRVLEKDPEKRMKMLELREHPWVTKSGEDPLLPVEENCASLVEPPTEAEMDTAITGNMGGLIAVLKAANKFKQGLERRHPELAESILGRASQMALPPLTMQNIYQTGSDIKGRIHRHLSRGTDGESNAGTESVTGGSGIYREGDVHRELGHLGKALKDSSINPMNLSLKHRRTEPQIEEPLEEDFVPKHFAEQRRHTYDETIKGHAHDVSKDVIFVDIGPGPVREGEEASAEPDLPYVVSESPPPTEGRVFEKAYESEVDKIRKSGRDTIVYLTRRVEKLDEVKEGAVKGSRWGKILGRSGGPTGSGEGQHASGSSHFRPPEQSRKDQEQAGEEQDIADRQESVKDILGSAVGKAMEVGGQKLQTKYGSSATQDK